MLRRALASPRVQAAVASGIALSAYVLNTRPPVKAAENDHIFVINGFYMSMRAAYTTEPASIHYYTVEWPAASLSWADFRGKVRVRNTVDS